MEHVIIDLLSKVRSRAATQKISEFTRDHLGLYLYGRVPGSEALGFRTRVVTPMGMAAIDAMRGGGGGGAAERFLLRVEKTARNTWARRISVGRATNNDLVIRHESVSKLHAHFMVRATDAGEILVIADAGSANGTHVNGRALAEGDDRAVTVVPGDRVRFGDVEAMLLDAAGLYHALRRESAASGDF